MRLHKRIPESSNTDRRININENLETNTTNPNSGREDEKKMEKILFLNRKKIKFRNNNLGFQLSQDKANIERSSSKKIKINLPLNTTRSFAGKKIIYKLNKDYNLLQNDFERKNLDKNLMTKNYLRKYSYYDKLYDKELKFQKQMLYFKYNNSLYNKGRTIEEKDGIIGKDDLVNISLIINEKAEAKNKNQGKNNLELDLLKGSFGQKQNQFSIKMKSAMSSVISKYISERKTLTGKQNLVDHKRIHKLNEKKLLILDNSIKNINNNISKMKYFIKKTK